MSRCIATTCDPDWDDDTTFADVEPPTRPVRRFDLEAESRRFKEQLAKAARRAELRDEEATMSVSAEENMRLLATAFANQRDEPNTDDEPTLEAPVPEEALEVLRVRSPAPPESPPESQRVTRPLPALVLTSLPPPRAMAPTHWIVAGIWATALTLFGLLAFIVSSA